MAPQESVIEHENSFPLNIHNIVLQRHRLIALYHEGRLPESDLELQLDSLVQGLPALDQTSLEGLGFTPTSSLQDDKELRADYLHTGKVGSTPNVLAYCNFGGQRLPAIIKDVCSHGDLPLKDRLDQLVLLDREVAALNAAAIYARIENLPSPVGLVDAAAAYYATPYYIGSKDAPHPPDATARAERIAMNILLGSSGDSSAQGIITTEGRYIAVDLYFNRDLEITAKYVKEQLSARDHMENTLLGKPTDLSVFSYIIPSKYRKVENALWNYIHKIQLMLKRDDAIDVFQIFVGNDKEKLAALEVLRNRASLLEELIPDIVDS